MPSADGTVLGSKVRNIIAIGFSILLIMTAMLTIGGVHTKVEASQSGKIISTATDPHDFIQDNSSEALGGNSIAEETSASTISDTENPSNPSYNTR